MHSNDATTSDMDVGQVSVMQQNDKSSVDDFA